jgi:hypothetical protein
MWFHFRCDNGSPDGRDIQAGLTDQTIYQRHVGLFLVFPVCDVWFDLQSANLVFYTKAGSWIMFRSIIVLLVYILLKFEEEIVEDILY